jgi:hypothetical protein
MAKGQKRGNREPKKPKQQKKAPIALSASGGGRNASVQATFSPRGAGVKS